LDQFRKCRTERIRQPISRLSDRGFGRPKGGTLTEIVLTDFTGIRGNVVNRSIALNSD
jgi:hypothetical protein